MKKYKLKEYSKNKGPIKMFVIQESLFGICWKTIEGPYLDVEARSRLMRLQGIK